MLCTGGCFAIFGLQRGLRLAAKGGEGGGIVDRGLGEHLAVHVDAGEF